MADPSPLGSLILTELWSAFIKLWGKEFSTSERKEAPQEIRGKGFKRFTLYKLNYGGQNKIARSRFLGYKAVQKDQHFPDIYFIS